ncbi:MAG: MptD family putative ECF transporter S component [Sporolactobacillus sp.]|uniref:MptD family putative ECF transporter S component n=1 Tax=Sporolactobacillus sp. STSJ-5 TaxID=2965076 RepID=UPI002107E0CB|nr:MptD family putative ECF transporter S component [Sporolactobacillus sp. STSJ-5]MCQ2010478.1 MptD family putative ECF transporter S component [Sporolactobacillus sp. STSJ-5]
MKKRFLGIRDVVTIAIFTAAIMIIGSALSKVFGVLSFLTAGGAILVSGAIISFLTAPLFLLMVLKVGKHGAIFLHSILYGFIFLLAGLPHMVIFYALVGLIGEVMMMPRGNGYHNVFRAGLACSVFLSVKALHPAAILWIIGNYNPQGVHGYTAAQITKMMDIYFNPITVALIFVLTFAGSAVGSWAGAKILRKHFVKSGILQINE